MKKLDYQSFQRACSAAEEIQDGRFFVVNCVLVELVSADDSDFLVAYQAMDVCGPDHHDEIAAAHTESECVGVIEIPGDQWSKANSVFAELFGVAMKDGLRGVKEFYDAVA